MSKAYRLWNQDDKKIIISQDIIFDEDVQASEDDNMTFPSSVPIRVISEDNINGSPSSSHSSSPSSLDTRSSSSSEPESPPAKLPPKWLKETLKDSKRLQILNSYSKDARQEV